MTDVLDPLEGLEEDPPTLNAFEQARQDIAAKLTAGGVANVTLDPRGQLPCVLVELPRVLAAEGMAGWAVEQHIHIIANPPGDLDATAWLLDQLQGVLGAFYGAPAEPTTFVRNDRDCPGYLVRLLQSITSPAC